MKSEFWSLLDTVGERLDRWPRPFYILFSVAISLGLSLLAFSPKFWLMGQPWIGTFEWDRALSFLHQCREPFTTDVEGAMRWRILPPLAAHWLHLPGFWPLLIPWFGLAILTWQWAAASERLLGDRLAAAAATLILGTSAGVITITNWHGINDAWFLVGLIGLCTGRGSASLIWPSLLCPWVDERFILGWAAALFCRWWLQERPVNFARSIVISAAALLPYVAIRLSITLALGDRGSGHFLANALAGVPLYLPYIHYGWWMGFRAAWLLLLAALVWWWTQGSREISLLGVGLGLVGLLSITLLAADLSRSTNLILPLVLCGAIGLKELVGKIPARRWLLGIATANLLIPFEMVVGNKFSPVWSMPMELLRLFKNHH